MFKNNTVKKIKERGIDVDIDIFTHMYWSQPTLLSRTTVKYSGVLSDGWQSTGRLKMTRERKKERPGQMERETEKMKACLYLGYRHKGKYLYFSVLCK